MQTTKNECTISSSTSLLSVSQNKINNCIMKMETINNNENLINAQRIQIKQEYLPPLTSSSSSAYCKFDNSNGHSQRQQQQHQHQHQQQSTILNLDTLQKVKTRPYWNESSEARERRLARNAERMRQKRANETEQEYRARLARNAEANRIRRQNETEVQRAIRLMKNAARQRMRRANENAEERARRLAKSAERMRMIRANAPRIEKPPLSDRLIGY